MTAISPLPQETLTEVMGAHQKSKSYNHRASTLLYPTIIHRLTSSDVCKG